MKRRGDALRATSEPPSTKKTGGPPARPRPIERLLAELREHEAEHGAVDTTAKADKPEAAGEATSEGNFSIDDV